MASVILPAVEWTPPMNTVVAALREEDELLFVCDSANDPITTDAPESAEVIVAGEPIGCAGKPHALATGMEHASDDIVVWTDDDVSRSADWLGRLVQKAREHGAATEVPVFVGGGLWRVVEPAFLLFLTNAVLSGDHVWGGGVAFDRTILDEEQFLTELRQTVGDDSLLSTYVDDPWVARKQIRHITAGGSPRAVYDRVVRFSKAAMFFTPVSTIGFLLVISLGLALSIVAPIAGITLATLIGAATYYRAGVQRGSVLLTFPSLVLLPVVLILGAVAPTFRWGSRTYRWTRKFTVVIVS